MDSNTKLMPLKEINRKIKLGYVLMAEHKCSIGIYKIINQLQYIHIKDRKYRLNLRSIYHSEQSEQGNYWVNLSMNKLERLLEKHANNPEHTAAYFTYLVGATNYYVLKNTAKNVEDKNILYTGNGNLGFKHWEKLRLRITNKPYTEYLL
jgi:hypothetical protein